MFENVNDGQMPDHRYPISSPMSLRFRLANQRNNGPVNAHLIHVSEHSISLNHTIPD